MRPRDRHRHRDHQPPPRPVGRMIVVFLAGVLTGALVGLRLALIALWRSGAESFLHGVGLFNKRWTNRLAMSALRAGQPRSPYAVIRHVGRRSGHAYATPVITARAPDAFIVPLAYGEKVDWYRNIRAAGSCTVEWQGQTYRVGAPAAIPATEAIPAFPRLWGLELRLYGITHFLQLPIITPGDAAEQVVARAAAQAPAVQTGRRVPRQQRQPAKERRTARAVPGSPDMPAVSRWAAVRATWETWVRPAWDAWRTTRRGPSAIAARQSERLAALVAFARRRSPYYRRLYQHLPLQPPTQIDDLRQFPPTTKAELMAHFDEWVTDPAVTRSGVEAFIADPAKIGQLYLGRYLVWTTSGTTGVSAVLLQDQRSLAIIDMLRFVRMVPDQLTLRTLRRLLRHRGWGAVVYLTGGHFAGVSFTEWERHSVPLVANRIRNFPVQAPLADLVSDLNRFDPVYLTGYASALQLLAQEQEAGRLHLQLLLVGSTAERLTPAARARIEAAFGCPVREGYSASEVPALAFACPQGRLHVNSDWYIAEPVDAAYQPVPAGQPSHTVLVTNLANFVQPIIRYDLGDSVALRPEPCPCGSPLPVIHVEGRSGELLTFVAPDGRHEVRLLPLPLVTLVEETAGVRRCQLIQTAPDRLTVRFEALPTADAEQVWPAVQQRLHAYLATQGLATVAVERSTELPSRDARGGKFRQVWSEGARPAAGAAPAAAGSRVG